jgi:hypothetical protein
MPMPGQPAKQQRGCERNNNRNYFHLCLWEMGKKRKAAGWRLCRYSHIRSGAALRYGEKQKKRKLRCPRGLNQVVSRRHEPDSRAPELKSVPRRITFDPCRMSGNPRAGGQSSYAVGRRCSDVTFTSSVPGWFVGVPLIGLCPRFQSSTQESKKRSGFQRVVVRDRHENAGGVFMPLEQKLTLLLRSAFARAGAYRTVFKVQSHRLQNIGAEFFPSLAFREDGMTQRTRAKAAFLRVANLED